MTELSPSPTASSPPASEKLRWDCLRSPDEVLAKRIRAPFALDRGRSERTRIELFDSFEHRLLRAGLALIRVRGRLRLVDAVDLRSLVCLGPAMDRLCALSWWDLEPGAFRELLRKHLKLRAATRLAAAELSVRELTVRNEDDKIVARLHSEQTRADGRERSHTLSLAPLRGYESEAEQVAREIAAASDSFAAATEPLATRLLESVEGARRPLSSKDPVPLAPSIDVHSAVTAIATFELRVARQNEAGLLDDIDTEFLHDYRVALRQLRSLLQLIKGAFPPDTHRELRGLLGRFARATNRLRDLDVYLLARDTYRERLPIALRAGLDPMFADFARERRRELTRVRRLLRSSEYAQQMTQLERRLDTRSLEAGPRAAAEIGGVALHELRRHFRKVLRRGRGLTADTPDTEVHALRIECKRLRYLLELFASVLEPTAQRKLVQRLKLVQDELGAFNDNAVQQRSLLHYLETSRALTHECAAAVGGLVALLHTSEREARSQLGERFAHFDRSSTRKLVRALGGESPAEAATATDMAERISPS